MQSLQQLPDATIERMTEFIMAGTYASRGRHGFRIPAIVVGDWAVQGYCVLRTNDLARKYGVCRRTMSKTIRRVIDAGFIKSIGRNEDGRYMYVPCFERGDEWRAARKERTDERG